MIDKSSRLRFRRRFRKGKRQVEDIGFQTEENIEKLFFKRLPRLNDVRRFVLSWLLLFVLLIGGVIAQTRALERFYQQSQPIPGGVFSEGILGAFTNANPIYATSSVDAAVSRLVFSGLMRFDDQNRLTQDLAESIAVDQVGSKYTVTLRGDIFWHDGKPVTADDVVFTFKTIQNPDAKSPLIASWQGVNVNAINNRTVLFTLPNALTAFPYSLTTGIVPKHLLGGVDASQLRSIRFNTASPVGAGPFKWETIEVSGTDPEKREEQIGLLPYEQFHRGKPKLERFIIRSFREERLLLESLEKQELHAASGIETQPDDINTADLTDYNVPLTSEILAFFKTSQAPLDDVKVRTALLQSINTTSIITNLGYPVIPARSPLLQSHVGYDKDITQLPTDVAKANKLLDEAGWIKDDSGLRAKAGKPLKFRMYSQSTSEYAFVSRELQKQWRDIGVEVEVILQPAEDLQQTTIAQHNYDILLYGIALGPDPDVFAYWHSSQASAARAGSLNFSEYSSEVADKSLEAGRTRSDEKLRAIKYKPFLTAWRGDAPAIALYQPRELYITRVPIANFEPTVFNTATDRYANIEKWMIREGKTVKE